MTDFATALYGDTSAASAPPTTTPTSGGVSSLTNAADVLYGAPTTAQKAPASVNQSAEPDQQAADAQVTNLTPAMVAAGVPDYIRAQRDADVARKLFSSNESELAKLISADDFPSTEPATAQAVALELKAIALDIGATADDVSMLRSALRRMSEGPLNSIQVVECREQVVDALNAKYGTDAKQALMDARKFVAADPRRAALLSSVGDDPRTVLRIVELARAAKTAGTR